jgi:hypothetical protein
MVFRRSSPFSALAWTTFLASTFISTRPLASSSLSSSGRCLYHRHNVGLIISLLNGVIIILIIIVGLLVFRVISIHEGSIFQFLAFDLVLPSCQGWEHYVFHSKIGLPFVWYGWLGPLITVYPQPQCIRSDRLSPLYAYCCVVMFAIVLAMSPHVSSLLSEMDHPANDVAIPSSTIEVPPTWPQAPSRRPSLQ